MVDENDSFTQERFQIPRRTVLAGAASGCISLAGCQTQQQTNTTKTTRGERPTATPNPQSTQTTTKSTTKTDQRSTEKATIIEFDGGGSAALANALARATKQPGTIIEIAKGTYRFDDSEAPNSEDIRTHFTLRDGDDILIKGNNATFIFEDPTRGALSIRNTSDITIQNLTIDYDPLPFTQGVIREWNSQTRTLIVEIQSGFPSLSAEVFQKAALIQASVHQHNGDRLTRVNGHGGAFKRFSSITQVGANRFRLQLADGIGTAGLSVGRVLAIAARFPSARAFRFRRCINPQLANVTIRTSPGFTVYCNYCAHPIAQNITISPPPHGNRIISSCSDGIHFDNCRQNPIIENCTVERIEDDGIVIDTQIIQVLRLEDSRTVRVAPSVGSFVAAGEQMEAASAEFERKGNLPPVAAINKQGGGKTHGPAIPETIIFADAVDEILTTGDYLTSQSFENRGFTVRNNEVRESNARLIRIGGGVNGVVEANHLVANNNDGILIEANGGGTPKRWVDNVRIRKNTLRQIGLVSIASGRPEGIVVNVAGTPVHSRDEPSLSGQPHRNVDLIANTIENIATTGIHLADTRKAIIKGNRIIDPGRMRMTALDPFGVGIDHATAVTIRNNRVVGSNDDIAGFGWRVASTNISMTGNAVIINGNRQSAELESIDDH